MNFRFIFILLFGITCTLHAQEVCLDGIDNDGDGLIDLNDTLDCVCDTMELGSSVSSFIPNPSFELYDYLPTTYSQLDACTGWEQATMATSDYFQTSSFVFSGILDLGLSPPPDGTGFVGFFVADIGFYYVEYVGVCLPSPLIAGTSYTYRFNIAGMPLYDDGSLCGMGAISPTTIDITIFGSNNCSLAPVSTYECPSAFDPAWINLGHATYVPATNWSTLEITFTPTTNINYIMLGGPCVGDIAPGYYAAFNTACYSYYVVDNLTLNESTAFADLPITVTGAICTNNLICTAQTDTNFADNVQWFEDGVAIAGETSQSIHITHAGNYTCMFYNDSSCVLGDVIIDGEPNQNFVLNDSICSGETISIGVANEFGHSYNWINNTANLSSTTLATVDANPPLSTTYTLVDNSDSVCYDTITVNLHVDVMPTANFSYSYEVACNTIHLTVMDSSTNATGGFWQLDSVQYPLNNHQYNIPVENVNHQLYLEVSNNGCTDSMAVFFNTSAWAPIINLIMPNVFTPNADATNDAYCPIGSNGSYCYKITIYNRWGTMVWESTNENPCWNGLDYTTHQPASEGVYYYILDFDGKMEKGFLHLFK